MKNFKIGDVVVCSKNELSGHTYSNLVVGDKYQVYDTYDLSANLDVWGQGLFLICLKTGFKIQIIPFPSSLFIPIQVYREFKLRQILD